MLNLQKRLMSLQIGYRAVLAVTLQKKDIFWVYLLFGEEINVTTARIFLFGEDISVNRARMLSPESAVNEQQSVST